MDVRLVQLLASFIRVSSEYALARLEFALHYPQRGAPPVIDRLPDASEDTLRHAWPTVEAQLNAALTYAKHSPITVGSTDRRDAAAWLRRTLQELEQYARAIQWVLTVNER